MFVDLDPAPKGNHGQLIGDGGMQDAGWISTGLDNYLELLMQRVASGRLIFRDGWVWTSRSEFVTDWYHVDEPSNRFNPKSGVGS